MKCRERWPEFPTVSRAALNLQQIVSELQKHYGTPAPLITDDPFELILLENVAYLVSDERREEAFKLLRRHAGTMPHEILAALNEDILKATRLGGMRPEERVGRLREIALIAMDEFDGDLKPLLKLPLTKAKQALRKFPSIGEPSAEKILMCTRSYPVLSLDSNALRVLVRLGFAEEKKNYTATYRAVQETIKDQLSDDYDWLIRTYLLLRQHGKELCKTNRPQCEKCPVNEACAYFKNRKR